LALKAIPRLTVKRPENRREKSLRTTWFPMIQDNRLLVGFVGGFSPLDHLL